LFSGIIEELAPVVSFERPRGRTARIVLKMSNSTGAIRLGDSISVNGVCLTVTAKRNRTVTFDVIEETLRVTNLGQLVKGDEVNVERGLSVSDRIDGHLVTGHIDGTGKITSRKRLADSSIQVIIQTRADLASLMVPKGCVAVDGISLTIVDVTRDSFSVCLIPRTLSETTLGRKKTGDSVNLEADLLAKYIRKFMRQTNIRRLR